jgi:hypothetical protein
MVCVVAKVVAAAASHKWGPEGSSFVMVSPACMCTSVLWCV